MMSANSSLMMEGKSVDGGGKVGSEGEAGRVGE